MAKVKYQIHYWKGKDGKWYWHRIPLRGGKVVAQGEGYNERSDLLEQLAREFPDDPVNEHAAE